jgi:Fe-S-cluster containining protein
VSLIAIRRRARGAAKPPWYAGGIRFECQRSTKCCVNHGDYAYVYLSRDDETRLAGRFGLDLAKFRNRYTEKLEGRRTLRFSDGACIFLFDGGCSVYEARPRQCATWPFWPENLDANVWREEIAPFCPGVGKGRLWSSEEIDSVAASLEPDED